MRTAIAGAFVAAAALVAACGPGTPAGGSCTEHILPGDLVITEVFADYQAPGGASGVDDGKEWFEIYNASDMPLELKGLTIVNSKPDGSKPSSHTMTAVTIAPGQYLTLVNSAPDLLPPYVDYGYSNDLSDLANTGGGLLTLSCGNTEIDRATFDSVKPGHSRELTAAQPPDYTLNDDATMWCQGNDTEFDSGNFGTPRGVNDCIPIVVGQCNDGGTMRDSVAPVPGALVITEIMPQPRVVSDTVGEWFEVQVIHDVDLNGVGLDRAGDSSNPDLLTSADCLHVSAGDRLVFARSADSSMNGGLTVAGTFKFSLINGSSTDPGDVRVMAGQTVIDAVTWTSSTAGKSIQLDPDLIDPIANDLESNFCPATTTYNGTSPSDDEGTPGQANVQCSGTTTGMCDMGGGSMRSIVKPTTGQLVITELMADPTGTDSTKEWFEITNTGGSSFDLNGLGLATTGGTATVIQSTACLPVTAGGFGLFARSNDPAVNGMLPAVDATFSFNLVNSSGSVEVRDGATVLDAVAWPNTATSGKSLQLDPAHFNTTDNDAATGVGTHFCLGTTSYGTNGDLGTPRAANASCP